MLSKSQKTFAWWFLTSGGSPGMARGRNKIPSTLLDALAAEEKEHAKQQMAAYWKGHRDIYRLKGMAHLDAVEYLPLFETAKKDYRTNQKLTGYSRASEIRQCREIIRRLKRLKKRKNTAR